MNVTMATRKPSNLRNKKLVRRGVEFQLHANYISTLLESNAYIIDFTEIRIRKIIKETHDNQEIIRLESVLKDYIDGKIACGWTDGELVSINVTKESL